MGKQDAVREGDAASEATRIEGGIEWFTVPGWGEDCQCARCGSSAGRSTCWNCGGEGYIELYDEDPMWYDEDDVATCDWCRGKGGFDYCLSGREWCEANPMPGREQIESTAREPHENDD